MKASGRKRGECGDAVNEQGTERRSASARDTQGRGGGGGVYNRIGGGWIG